MSWLLVEADAVTLRLHVQPGAKKTGVVGPHGMALKIRLAAAPVDGKANACLLAYLAGQLGVGKAAIHILSGEASRAKRLRIVGVDPDVVRDRLKPG